MNRISMMLVFATTAIVSGTIGPVSVHAQTNEPAIGQATTVAATDISSEETLAWEAAIQSGDSEALFAFIEAYPNGAHIKEAKLRVIDMLWVELEDDEATSEVATETEVAPAEPEIITALPTGEIELKSADGFVSVIGIITAYDDAMITIKTSYGTVGIENDGISCVGATCPSALLATQ